MLDCLFWGVIGLCFTVVGFRFLFVVCELAGVGFAFIVCCFDCVGLCLIRVVVILWIAVGFAFGLLLSYFGFSWGCLIVGLICLRSLCWFVVFVCLGII